MKVIYQSQLEILQFMGKREVTDPKQLDQILDDLGSKPPESTEKLGKLSAFGTPDCPEIFDDWPEEIQFNGEKFAHVDTEFTAFQGEGVVHELAYYEKVQETEPEPFTPKRRAWTKGPVELT